MFKEMNQSLNVHIRHFRPPDASKKSRRSRTVIANKEAKIWEFQLVINSKSEEICGEFHTMVNKILSAT